MEQYTWLIPRVAVPLRLLYFMKHKGPKKKERSASAPLLCWDLFMEGYHRRMRMGEDLQQLKALALKHEWKLSWEDLSKKFMMQGKVIVVTDLSLKIVFASSNMVEMSGYLPKEVLGRTPKIFQGTDTSETARREIRNAVMAIQPFHVTLLNYKRNGVPYDCEVQAFPVVNQSGNPVHFIAFENLAA
jgi:PAS domain S-box-containing protein